MFAFHCLTYEVMTTRSNWKWHQIYLSPDFIHFSFKLHQHSLGQLIASLELIKMDNSESSDIIKWNKDLNYETYTSSEEVSIWIYYSYLIVFLKENIPIYRMFVDWIWIFVTFSTIDCCIILHTIRLFTINWFDIFHGKRKHFIWFTLEFGSQIW